MYLNFQLNLLNGEALYHFNFYCNWFELVVIYEEIIYTIYDPGRQFTIEYSEISTVSIHFRLRFLSILNNTHY